MSAEEPLRLSPRQVWREGWNLAKPRPVDAACPRLSLDDAAEALRISKLRLRMRVNNGFLEAVQVAGEPVSVSYRSVSHEMQWRATAGLIDRVRRLLTYVVHGI